MRGFLGGARIEAFLVGQNGKLYFRDRDGGQCPIGESEEIGI